MTDDPEDWATVNPTYWKGCPMKAWPDNDGTFYGEADWRMGELDPPSEFSTQAEHRAWTRGITDALRIVREIEQERLARRMIERGQP